MTEISSKRWQRLAGILTEATHTINDDDDFASDGIRFDPEKEDLSVHNWDSGDKEDSVIDLIDAEEEYEQDEMGKEHRTKEMFRKQAVDLMRLDGLGIEEILSLVRDVLNP